MAFAPKGSRPQLDDPKRNVSSKSLEDNRMPAIVAAAPPRERITRKPPVPRVLARINPPVKQTKVTAPSARRPNPVPKPRNAPISVVKPQPKTSRVTSKPALPPKLKINQTEVAPDSLTISAQLAPWLYMRASLEGPLEQLENETEEILKAERERLIEAQKLVEESQLRQELQGQIELLEDLLETKNTDFSTSLSTITKDISSFISQSSSASNPAAALETLQDKVYSTEWESETLQTSSNDLDAAIQQGQAIKHRLDDLRAAELTSQWSLKHPSRWKFVMERFSKVLESRIRNLQVLRGAVASVIRYQKRRMELQILDAAIS